MCGGMVFIEVRHAIHVDKGRLSAGAKGRACASCMARGEMVIL